MMGCRLSGQVLGQVCDGIALDLHAGCSPGETGGGSGEDTGGMVHKVGGKGGVLDLGVGHFPGELVDDGTNHLQVPEFFGT